MAEASSAAEASTQPEPSNNPPTTNERNDEVAEDESAPLLQSEGSSPPPTRRLVSAKFIHFLTSLAMFSAVLTLALLIVTGILMSVLRNGDWIPGETGDGMGGVVIPALFSIFICGVNLARIRRNRPLAPLAFNMLLDVLIAAFAIGYAAGGLAGLDPGLQYRWGQLPVEILAGMALGFALIFGVVHLVLFVIRCRIAFTMDSWRNPFSFPSGQLTFEVSIKFFKEPQKPSQGGQEIV